MEMDVEKKIADEIMKTVRKLKLPLRLDQITEGKGDCFPLATIAQCKRHDIYSNLNSDAQNVIIQNDPTLLRSAVMKFIMSSNCRTIVEFRKRYENVVAPIDGTTWNQYWEKMSCKYEWVDYTFIQSTAWFLNHDIQIVTTSSTEHDPYMTIQGNPLGENLNSYFPPLIMGCKTNSHYQSLLPYHCHGENNASEIPVYKRICSAEEVENPKPSYADVA